jgi:GrpB-like predicted nucleotidyltransferase (UPF0157 family)
LSIVVTDYDPGWPAWFEAGRAGLEPVLSPWLSGGIHHIGSTAVPGLAAKPIMDMIAGARDLAAAAPAIAVLRELSYAHAPDPQLAARYQELKRQLARSAADRIRGTGFTAQHRPALNQRPFSSQGAAP